MMKAILWTRDHCGYCDMAKKELMLRGYEVKDSSRCKNCSTDIYIQ